MMTMRTNDSVTGRPPIESRSESDHSGSGGPGRLIERADEQAGEQAGRDLLEDSQRLRSLLEDAPPASQDEQTATAENGWPFGPWTRDQRGLPAETTLTENAGVPAGTSGEIAEPDGRATESDAETATGFTSLVAGDDSQTEPSATSVSSLTSTDRPVPPSGAGDESLDLESVSGDEASASDVETAASPSTPQAAMVVAPQKPRSGGPGREAEDSSSSETFDSPDVTTDRPVVAPAPVETASGRDGEIEPAVSQSSQRQPVTSGQDGQQSPTDTDAQVGLQHRVEPLSSSSDSGDSTNSDDSHDTGELTEADREAVTDAPPMPNVIPASPGDTILQGMQSVREVAPVHDAPRLEVFREVADRILVSDVAFSGEQEVRVTIKESILPGTEVRIAHEDGRLVVRLVTQSDQSHRILTQQQDALQNYLRDRLENRDITVDLSMETDSGSQGRSRNRQDPYAYFEEENA